MDTITEYLIVTLGATGVVIVVLITVGTALSKRFLDAVFKQYESRLEEKKIAFEKDLQHQYNETIERLKSQLAVAAKQNEVRFSKLHEKRLEAIGSLYQVLEEARQAAMVFDWTIVTSGVSDDFRRDNAREVKAKINQFTSQLALCKLYFSQEVADTLAALAEKIYSPALEYEFVEMEGGNAAAAAQTVKNQLDAQKTSIDMMLSEISGEFRRLLGSAESTA